MEQKDTQNVGHDQEGLSKRRISSILKAPRTSMKVFGNEQDENQEETRPIEKRRNSRRVSFATTNNIRVFPKDLKADPVIAPTQNMTVGTNEGQNERTSCFDSSVNYEVIGLDTMLTQPVQFELNKGNIFPEPHLPFDSVDKTVLLGENMDMTYSHTVVFDKEDEFNPESILSMSNANDPHKLSSQNDTTSKSFGVVEKDVMLTQFEDFLASLPMNQNAATSIPNKNKDNFTLENVSNMKMDEENVLPTGLNKLAFSERDDMDMSMTNVIMEEREALLHFPYSGDGNYDADDMEMTLCQTVLETKSCDDYKPSDKPKKRVSLGSTAFRTKDMSPEHTGQMELNRYSFSKRTKTEDCVVPTAQKFLHQDVSNCMEAQQDTVSDMSVIHDDMELTELKTITIDTKTWLTSPSNKAQSSPYVISSKTSTDKIKWSESNLAPVLASQTVSYRPPISVMDSDGGNLKTEDQRDQTTDTRSHHKTPKGSNSVNEHVSFNSTVKIEESSEEDSNMIMTTVITAPLVEQCCAAFNEETAGESAVTVPVTTDQKICTEIDSDLDTLKKEPLSSVKSRQKCLSDLKVKLQNISQYIIEPDGLLAGSVTAPLASFTAASPLELDNSLQLSKEAQPLGNQMNLAHKESTTPFNLRKSLMARLSVGGIMPKFPSRAGLARLNQVEPKSPNEAQDLQPQTCFNVDVQSNSNETDLIDEVLPEDDFSGTLVSDLSKSKVQEVTTEVHEHKDQIESDHMESIMNMSQSEEIPPEVKDANTNDSSVKLWDSNFAAQNASTHVVKTNSSGNSTMMKFEGNSELTLRNSQLDSQLGDSMDHEFDFYKKLKDGSVTVNEFLTYFGANTVIHRSRPSALPDNFRATQTSTTEELLREKYIHRPKQKVYETDCQKLSEMAEGFKTQIADQDKPLRSINETLLQDICAFSKEQLQRFGSKLKERKMYYRKGNKARSHKMKEHLYSELLKTTQEAKQSLTSKIKETNEMINDLDGCINDLEAELSGLKHIGNGDQHSLIRLDPALKAKQEQFEALNSEVTEKEKQIRELELQSQSLEDTRKKVQDETRDLEYQLTNLNSLNEWRVISVDKNGLVFSFLHNTLHLEVKHRKATGDEFIQNDPEQEVDISFKFLLNTDTSQPSAIMVHKLLKENLSNQSKWQQKDLTMQKIPMLLHNVSLVVSRLRLLGEEIYRLDKWGGVRLGIFHITCVDTFVEVTFSSVEAFAKFELSLAVNSDYPFRPLQLQKFQNFIGDTRLEQITHIVSSVKPAKNYLTSVMKKIHSDLLG